MPTPNPAPAPGDTVYLVSGQEAELISITPDGRFVVSARHHYEDWYDYDEHERYLGDPQICVQVFKEPPVAIYDERISAARAILDDINEKISSGREALRKMSVEHTALLKELEREVPVLRRIRQFLKGEMTHFVVNRYNGWEILDRETILKYDDWEYKTKLLTLFGKAEGDLEWRLDSYSDGSGGSNLTVIPCTSHEEAVSVATEKIRVDLADDNTYRLHKAVAAAQRLGIEIPPELIKKLNASRLKALEGNLSGAIKEKDEARKKLAAAKSSADKGDLV